MNQEQRVYLAQYFSDIAGWHDDPSRNGHNGAAPERSPSALVYSALADHILALDENDLRLVALTRLTDFDDGAGFFPGPRLSAAIADVERFVDGEPDTFLDYLVRAALDDRLDTEHRGGTLPVVEIEASTGQSMS